MSQEQWYISTSEEYFGSGPLDSREEAIEEGKHCWEGAPFFIGKRADYQAFQRDWLDEVLELETNDVYDECGPDAADNWPDRATRDNEYDKANEDIRAILTRIYGKPTVFKIEKVERIVSEEKA